MMSIPSFSYCALTSELALTVCSLLGPTLAFGPSMPGIVELRSAENFRKSVFSTLPIFCVSFSVLATE